MRDEPSVTVVIPTRNRPRGLEQALRSVLDQGVSVEVVVVDEASSPPATVPAIELDNVTLVRREEAEGPSSARNCGAAMGRAPYVAFLDDDDVWLPDKLEHCLQVFERWPDLGMVMHRMRFAGQEHAGTDHVERVADPLAAMLLSQPPHVGAVLVRREVHDAVGFDESFAAAEDLDYMIRAAQQAPIARLDRVLGEHGPPDAQLTEIGLQTRIRAREQLRAKHRDLFRGRADAFYWMRMGHLHRRGDERGAAARCFLRSLRLQPANGYAWRGLAACVLPRRVVETRASR